MPEDNVNPDPPAGDSGTNRRSMIETFLKNARLAAATAETVARNAEALNAALERETAEYESVLLPSPDDLDVRLFATFARSSKVITAPDTAQLKTTGAGVTDAFCGVASTGSVCVSVSRNLTAPTGMLTRKHIVVLEGKSIVPRPRDVLSAEYLNGEGLRRSFSFITGPSATADMGPLVRGVHGPGKLHIIVLE